MFMVLNLVIVNIFLDFFYSPCLWSVTVWSGGRHLRPRLYLRQVSGRWSSPPSGHSEVCGHSDPEHSETLRDRSNRRAENISVSFGKHAKYVFRYKTNWPCTKRLIQTINTAFLIFNPSLLWDQLFRVFARIIRTRASFCSDLHRAHADAKRGETTKKSLKILHPVWSSEYFTSC